MDRHAEFFMKFYNLEIEKGRVERDIVWRQHGKMRTALFEELKKDGNSHFIRPLIYEGKGHVMIVSFSVSDRESMLQGNYGARPATRH